jgi:hypothetical protein
LLDVDIFNSAHFLYPQSTPINLARMEDGEDGTTAAAVAPRRIVYNPFAGE